MAESAARAASFLALHQPGAPLLMPNPWDCGSAKVFEFLGFQALATTSSGFAATLGRLDGGVTRDEAVGHAALIAATVGVPVSADLENCFADDPAGVADTVRMAVATGLAGCSVEDSTQRPDDPIYEAALAADRVAAAAEVAHQGDRSFVITARSENFLWGRDDLADTIARLQSFQTAGADVLFAPGVRDPGAIRSIISSVDRPVSVLLSAAGPSVPELAELGAARISTGGSLAYLGYGAAAAAAKEMLAAGGVDLLKPVGSGRDIVQAALGA